MTWSIVTVRIESERDVVKARQRARLIAELIGFDNQDQVRIATAVSEIARNAYSYGGGGDVSFAIDDACDPQGFVIRITDGGPGIADLDAVLEGRYRSEHGMGLGIVGARRLMDRFGISSEPGRGVSVELAKALPRRQARVTRSRLGTIIRALRQQGEVGAETAVVEQNRALLHSLQELQDRQQELQRVNDELADTNRGVVALYAELEDAAEQVRRASESKSRFLSSITHEFRTPLNSILALSRLLLDRVDGELAPEQERQVELIRGSAANLAALVDDLLDLAKVEAGKLDVRPTVVSVAELFRALRATLKPLVINADVELVFDPADDVPNLYTDETKVTQILRNFISNALKFTVQGEVRVSASRDEEGLLFRVRDTGIGIDPKHHGHIFEEFAQVTNALQKRARGTGLGLSLSRRFADLLGGTVGVESALGEGSTFWLRLAPSAVVGADGPAAQDLHRPIKVLVIDDDATFRYVISHVLRTLDMVELTECSDGESGLTAAQRDKPHVIFLDLQMSPMDGWTVLEAIAKDESFADTHVIVVTSLGIGAEMRHHLARAHMIVGKDDLSAEDPPFEGRAMSLGQQEPSTIINVDDDDAARYIKTRVLRAAGFHVLEAVTGMAGVELIETHLPDLALLDVRLPDMDGLELCTRVKKRWPEIMVLQISATLVTGFDRVRGLESGADSYLTQPVAAEELIAVVNALLRLRRAERDLHHANETLEDRVRERTERLEQEIAEKEATEAKLRQAQKMEAVGQLTGGIAHDFNNLLTAIIGNLARLRSDIEAQRPPQLKHIDGAAEAAQRAASLTKRLLAFSRRQPLSPAPVAVPALFANVLSILQQTVGAHIRLEAEASEDVAPIWCDGNQLENALINLALNSRDAMPGGGTIVMRARNVDPSEPVGDEADERRYVLIEVEDDGAGMPPAVLDRVFDPFFTTKPIGQGTGLGLSQVYGFVRQSEGHVVIDSTEGNGTRVRVFLPRAEEVAAVELPSASPAPLQNGGGETVLVVEDEALVRLMTVDTLEEAGFAVVETGWPAEALDVLAKTEHVKLLLTDVGLPGMNGRQLAELARQARPDLKIIFMTGYAPTTPGEAPIPNAAIIQKPFLPEDLLRRVQEMLARP